MGWQDDLEIGTLVTVSGAVGRVAEQRAHQGKYSNYSEYRIRWKRPQRNKTHGDTWYHRWKVRELENLVEWNQKRIGQFHLKIHKIQLQTDKFTKLLTDNEGLDFGG